MLITTPGIVFRFTKYRETSVIAQIFTRELGLHSFIANNVRSAKSKFKIGYFEPLSLLEITAYHKQGRDIDRITEIKFSFPLYEIRKDIYKSTMCMFIAEVLNKCIVEQHNNEALFDFLQGAIIDLERATNNNNYHVHFLIKLASHLGFEISDASTLFSRNSLKAVETSELVKIIETLMILPLNENPQINPGHRKTLLPYILDYYHENMDMPVLKSLAVLKVVFD